VYYSSTLHQEINGSRTARCGCPPAREPYPGYFTNKYPLRYYRYLVPTGIPGAGALLLGNHIRVTLRTNTRCGKSNIPHTCGCPPAREPHPGHVTNKYPQREIKHPAHNASLSKHIRITSRRYILSAGKAPCGCPAAREQYPDYFINKHPLREIKHPAHIHTGLKLCTRHHPAQERGGFLVSNIYLSKILVVNASLLKLLPKLLPNQPDTSCSTNKHPQDVRGSALCQRSHSTAIGPWTGRSYPGCKMNCSGRDGP
jgi:hypothetical protein